MNENANPARLVQLRNQAKDLLKAIRANESPALQRSLAYFPSSHLLKLADAQLVLARENGYASWAKLKHDLEGQAQPKTATQRLFEAIEAGDTSTALDLLEETPELAASWLKYEWGWTSALHVAAKLGHLEICQALLDNGAVVYAANQGDYPPVFDAVYYKHKAVSDLLMETSAKTDGGIPPTFGLGIDLILAARLGMVDKVAAHIERDPLAIYRRGCIGESALHWPAHNGHVEVLAYLLDHGAPIEVDEIGLYGGKPLHWAGEHAPACVQLLLSRGADPNSRNLKQNDFEGFTPLHMCASQRNEEIECARLLLEAGSDPSLKDAKGRTPLGVAEEKGHQKMAKFLSGRKP